MTDEQVLQKGTSSSQLNLDSLKKVIGERGSKRLRIFTGVDRKESRRVGIMFRITLMFWLMNQGEEEGIWLKGITSVIQKILIFSRGLRLPGGTSG